MKKILKLEKFLNLFSKANKKNIKLNVEGKFNRKGKFTLQIRNLECDNKLAKKLGFIPDLVDEEKIVIKYKNKKPTLRETVTDLKDLVINGFDNLNKRIDSIDKRLSDVEKNQKRIMNTPTMKKEL